MSFNMWLASFKATQNRESYHSYNMSRDLSIPNTPVTVGCDHAAIIATM